MAFFPMLSRLFGQVRKLPAPPLSGSFASGSMPTTEEDGLTWLKNNMKPSKVQGEVVIACPNEWSCMVIGRVQGELENGILVIDDFVSGKVQIVFSPWVKFDISELKTLSALNPYERYNRVAKNSSVDMSKPKLGTDELTFGDYLYRISVRWPEWVDNTFKELIPTHLQYRNSSEKDS
jgi:hypothetical protein